MSAFKTWAELRDAIKRDERLTYHAPMDVAPVPIFRAVAYKNGKIRIWGYDSYGYTLEESAEQLRRFGQ